MARSDNLTEHNESPRAHPLGSFCRHCGYDLSDLGVRTCPECGGVIDNAPFAYNSAQARRLHIGVCIAETATILAAVGSIPASMIVDIIGNIAGFGAGAQRSLISLYDLAVALALGIGWWLFSTPHPVELQRGPDRRRAWLRAAVVLKVCVATAVAVLALCAPSLPVLPNGVITAAEWAGTLSTFLVAWGAIVYIRVMARRLGSSRVWFAARTRLFLLGYLAGAVALVGAVYAAGPAMNVRGMRPLAILLGVPTALGAVLWYIFYLVLVDQARRLVLAVRIWHWRAEESGDTHPDPPAAG